MTEYAKKLLRLYHEQGKKDRMIEGLPPLSFTSGSPGNLKNYRIFGNSVEQVISNNLFYKVISGAGMQTDGTIKSDSSYNMLFAKIIPGQDYIAAKGEVNSTALTYTLYNVYDHDPDIGSQALLPSWKSTNNNGIINYTGDTPVYLGLRVSASIAFPHLNIGTTICDYDEYEASITGVGDKVTDSQYLIPVTITNGADTQTTNLYLPKPLRMTGDKADYIDFKEQKLYFADGTSISVNLPTIFASVGMNTICIETNVVPSGVRIKGKFEKITTTYVQSIEPDNTNNKIIFVVRAYLSKNDRMVRTGLVATNDPAIGVNINVNSTVITSGCKVFVKELAGVTPTTNNTEYTWTKTKVTDGEIWYVRSYVEYINSDNEQLIIYSDAAKASLDGIIKTYTII
jgi:hypothetical protein